MTVFSRFDQETQIHSSETYDDEVSPGVALEYATGTSNIQADLNAIRSQYRRLLKVSGNWYDDLPTINSKKRDFFDVATHLDALEEHKFLYRTLRGSVPDLTVPAAATATGAIAVVTGAELTDGDYFTVPVISDAGVASSIKFEYDSDNSVVETDILRAIDFVGTETLSQIRNLTKDAVNNATLLYITATNGAGDGDIVLTEERKGAVGNVIITENVTDSDFTVTSMTGGAGDVVVLSVASSEAPNVAAAIGTATTAGAVVALNTVFPNWSGAEVTSGIPIKPKNLCIVRNAASGEDNGKIISGPNGKDVYALIQCENAVNGHTFDDDDEQVMISFVYENDTGNDLLHLDASYIGGYSINYQYVVRSALDNIPEDAYLDGVFTDYVGDFSMTRHNSYVNQGTTPVELGTNATLDLNANNITWDIRDQTNTSLFSIAEGSDAGDTTVTIGSAVDVLTINSISNTFNEPVTIDDGGTPIEIGVTTAGTINTTGTDSLTLLGALALNLDDGYRTGSDFAVPLALSSSSDDWDNFETQFTEVSLLEALVSVSQDTERVKTWANVIGADINAGTNITGAAGSPNISAQLPSYKGLTFVDAVEICINGKDQRPATDTSYEVYPGTTAANGDFKCTYKLRYRGGSSPDVICMTVWGHPTP